MSTGSREALQAKLAGLEAELKDREKALPAHSIRPHQLIEIEELEDQVARVREQIADLELDVA